MHRQKWIGKKSPGVLSVIISSGKADKEFKFSTSLLYCLCVFQLFFNNQHVFCIVIRRERKNSKEENSPGEGQLNT